MAKARQDGVHAPCLSCNHRGTTVTSLPYVTAPGNIERALKGIKAAATPERVSQDFVKTVLKIPGGSGDQMTSFLKKIGFTSPDGAPTDIYRKFRNASTSGRACADALRYGYGPLYRRNEYMHQLNDDELRGLIIEETGQEKDSNVVGLILATIKGIKKHASWADKEPDQQADKADSKSLPAAANLAENVVREKMGGLGLNLSYTINLNLPATSDVAVFNAIFKSLKEHLLRGGNE